MRNQLLRLLVGGAAVCASGLLGSMAQAASLPTLSSGNLRLWLETENGEGVAYNTTGGLVDSWIDQSGNGFDLTAGGSDRPDLTAGLASINNHSAVRFNGIDDQLTGFHDIFGATSGESTVFIVMELVKPSAFAFVFDSTPDGGAGRRGMYVTTGGLTFFRDGGGGGSATNAGYTDGDYGYATMRLGGSGIQLSVDGGADVVTGGVNNAPASTDTFRLATRYNAAESYLAADIAELIIYDTGLEEADISLVEAYIENKYFPIPEPGTMVLCSTGALLLLRRRQ